MSFDNAVESASPLPATAGTDKPWSIGGFAEAAFVAKNGAGVAAEDAEAEEAPSMAAAAAADDDDDDVVTDCLPGVADDAPVPSEIALPLPPPIGPPAPPSSPLASARVACSIASSLGRGIVSHMDVCMSIRGWASSVASTTSYSW